MADPALSIRAGRPDDVAAVHLALRGLARHIGAEDYLTNTPKDLLRDGFGDVPRVWFAIAEIGGDFAGMCLHFPIYSTWMGRPGVFIQDLYVEDRFRGRKVGAALLRHVARLSRDEGGAYLRLAVDTDNLTAIGFYERLGIARSEYEQVQKITGDAFIAFCDGKTR